MDFVRTIKYEWTGKQWKKIHDTNKGLPVDRTIFTAIPNIPKPGTQISINILYHVLDVWRD